MSRWCEHQLNCDEKDRGRFHVISIVKKESMVDKNSMFHCVRSSY